jgi:hypothetical protein
MKDRAVAWASLTLVLALPCACADVTEAVAASTNDIGTSSGGPATGVDDDPSTAGSVDTTDGSASASDAATDVGDTVANETAGLGDGSSGDTTGAPTSSTSTSDGSTEDGGTTMAAADPCDPGLADSPCDTCAKMACCPQIQTCFQDVGCACLSTCLGDGNAWRDCYVACGLVESPPGADELFMCATDNCDLAC